jgi:hypothetical protein
LQAVHRTFIVTIKEFTGILIEARLIKSVFSPVGTALSVVEQRIMIRGMTGELSLGPPVLFRNLFSALATGRNRKIHCRLSRNSTASPKPATADFKTSH